MLAKQQGLNQQGAKDDLLAALADINQVAERMAPASGLCLGIHADAQLLLGISPQAEQDFAAALRAPEFGGQALYDATLKTLDMHPIPEDTDVRALVERTWAAYQQEQGGETTSTPPPGA